jgi:hypothetical protein
MKIEDLWSDLDHQGEAITRQIEQARTQEEINAAIIQKQQIIKRKAQYAIIYHSRKTITA